MIFTSAKALPRQSAFTSAGSKIARKVKSRLKGNFQKSVDNGQRNRHRSFGGVLDSFGSLIIKQPTKLCRIAYTYSTTGVGHHMWGDGPSALSKCFSTVDI